MQRNIVDLPDPEPPMIATTSPSRAVIEMPFNTSNEPKDFRRFSIRIASGFAGRFMAVVGAEV